MHYLTCTSAKPASSFWQQIESIISRNETETPKWYIVYFVFELFFIRNFDFLLQITGFNVVVLCSWLSILFFSCSIELLLRSRRVFFNSICSLLSLLKRLFIKRKISRNSRGTKTFHSHPAQKGEQPQKYPRSVFIIVFHASVNYTLNPAVTKIPF